MGFRHFYDYILVSVIAPYEEDRKKTRDTLGEAYVEVFVDCPLSVCEARDVKGLYKKARKGDIDNFIGVHDESPYENPTAPEVVIHTDETRVEDGVKTLLHFLKE